MPTKQLTARQQRFCHEFLLDSNGTRAAERAGYSVRTAKQQASRLLTNVNVQGLIVELTVEQSNRIDFDSDRVLLELKHLATSTMADFIDDKGRLITDLSKVRPEAAAAVECCEESVKADGSIVRKIKLFNKVTALEKAGRHVKVRAFEDRSGGPADVNITVVSGIDGTPGSSC
jgi:phage terminase small subunit